MICLVQKFKEIKKLYSIVKYIYCDLTKLYNVSYSIIGYIIRKNNWNYKEEYL